MRLMEMKRGTRTGRFSSGVRDGPTSTDLELEAERWMFSRISDSSRLKLMSAST
jgi:hypothetical protein